jgi:hypothetical protein
MSGNSTPNKGQRKEGGYALEECDIEPFSTQLFSPAPAIVSKLKKGDWLRIELDPGLTTVLAITLDGNVAGTIMGKNMSRLASCLRRKYRFKGEVTNITGGNCTLTIISD